MMFWNGKTFYPSGLFWWWLVELTKLPDKDGLQSSGSLFTLAGERLRDLLWDWRVSPLFLSSLGLSLSCFGDASGELERKENFLYFNFFLRWLKSRKQIVLTGFYLFCVRGKDLETCVLFLWSEILSVNCTSSHRNVIWIFFV